MLEPSDKYEKIFSYSSASMFFMYYRKVNKSQVDDLKTDYMYH